MAAHVRDARLHYLSHQRIGADEDRADDDGGGRHCVGYSGSRLLCSHAGNMQIHLHALCIRLF
jgi:hypothetical protein